MGPTGRGQRAKSLPRLGQDQGAPEGQHSGGLTVLTFGAVEARVAGAGVAPDGLDAFSLLAAGRVVAGGCVDTEGSGPQAFPGSGREQ